MAKISMGTCSLDCMQKIWASTHKPRDDNVAIATLIIALSRIIMHRHVFYYD
jgi:hypothetical protein